MQNRKLFNSKNISVLIETLIASGKQDLAFQVMNLEQLKPILPNIINVLKRKNIKIKDYEETKIYSKTELSKELLEKISESLNIQTKSAKIIIDENMSAGVKIKSRDRLIDASLKTMLQNGIEELLKNEKKV